MNVYYLPLFLFSQTYSRRPPCVSFCVTMSWRPAVSPASSLFPCQPPETLASLHPPLPSNVFFPPLSLLFPKVFFSKSGVSNILSLFFSIKSYPALTLKTLSIPPSYISSPRMHIIPHTSSLSLTLILVPPPHHSLTHLYGRPVGQSIDRTSFVSLSYLLFSAPFFFSPSLISKCQVKSKSTCTENPYIQV